jgi:hypothetical protein
MPQEAQFDKEKAAAFLESDEFKKLAPPAQQSVITRMRELAAPASAAFDWSKDFHASPTLRDVGEPRAHAIINPQGKTGYVGQSKLQSALAAGGRHAPALQAKSKGYEATEMLPAIGGTVGGMLTAETGPGAIAGAIAGGAMGRAAEHLIKEKVYGEKPPVTVTEGLVDVGKAGLEQGAYELGGQVAGRVVGTMARPVTKALKGIDAAPVRRLAQWATGTGAKLTEKEAAEQTTKYGEQVAKTGAANAAEAEKAAAKNLALGERHTAASRKAFRANLDAITEHSEATAKVDALNAAKQEQVTHRAALAQQVESSSNAIGQELKRTEGQARAKGGTMFDMVRSAVKDDAVEASPLTASVRDAERNIIKGSSENIKQFREILDRGAEQTVQSSLGAIEPGTSLYRRLVSEGAITPPKPLTFSELHGFYSELGDRLAAHNLPGDVYQAVKSVRNAIGEQMDTLAERNGVLPQLRAAKQYWSEFMETFHNTDALKNSGSPAAHALKASDAGYYLAPFLSKAGGRGTESLKAYNPELAKSIEQAVRDYREMDGLPKKFTPKEAPAPPKMSSLPKPPRRIEAKVTSTPEFPKIDPAQIKKDAIEAMAHPMRKVNFWDIAAVPGGVVELVRGGVPYAWAYPMLKHGTGRLLEKPAVLEWLAKPSVKDFEVLRALPNEAQSQARQQISQLLREEAAKGNRIDIGPAMSAFLRGGGVSRMPAPPTRTPPPQPLTQSQ